MERKKLSYLQRNIEIRCSNFFNNKVRAIQTDMEQRITMKRTPTQQQQAVIDAVGQFELVKVESCAGAGKTSTLAMCAEAYEVPSLYLAFNKSAATDASNRFPKHVTCQTTHSRAYATFGKTMAHKMNRPSGKYVNVAGTGSEIARYYDISPIQFDEHTVVGAGFVGVLVRQTVGIFESSAESEVELKHVPSQELKEKLHDHIGNVRSARNIVLKYAKKLWADRQNLNSPVLATHDTYLKLFQLSKPVFGGVDILYVDEFQDTTPCVLDIVMNQKGRMKIVMVGDARQAIYGWRGAVNAMQMVSGETRSLTKSFRYGQRIADIATAVLERDMVITGLESIDSKAGLESMVDRTKPHMRLFRTNAALIESALPVITSGTPCALEIDVKDIVKLLQSALALHGGIKKDVKHDKILPYQNWNELALESKNDPELGRIARAVKEGNAERWVQTLERHVNAQDPLVVFTTAHKSKGREHDQVIVESDFKTCYNDDNDWVGLSVEEQNLLYVAVTRAINVLEYNLTTQEYLNKGKAEDYDLDPVGSFRPIGAQIAAFTGHDYGMSLRGEMAQEAVMREEGNLYEWSEE
jgi:hypothetical protein